jgi:hypothetical protein
MEKIPHEAQPVGYLWLVNHFHVMVNPHFCWSYIIKHGARRTLTDATPIINLYDQGYAFDDFDDPLQHLVFALKHEGLNLEIISALWNLVAQEDVFKFIAEQPGGKYQRIMWYLYEKLTNKILDFSGVKQGVYIDLLDSTEYYTAEPIKHRRYRINDNLLGNLQFCPFVRKTAFLKTMESKQLDVVARSIIKAYGQQVLERASMYLYAHETMSSYKIEREMPSKKRLARFIQLIQKAENIPVLIPQVLISLQNNLVDERFMNTSYRVTQNYVGQMRDWYEEIIHYIAPRPENVNELMTGLLASLERMLTSKLPPPPFVIAATISFGFVFIHPFDDGNGRLHRFLIHYILHKTGFTPPGMVFPVSARMLADFQEYTNALESFSKPLMELITNYEVDAAGVLTVKQQTASLYRYIDYTKQTEYLASCIEQTINIDVTKELKYVVSYDNAKKELKNIIDMPDQLLDLFIRLIIQNKGALSQNKRITFFKDLTDDEIKRMEEIVQQCFALA